MQLKSYFFKAAVFLLFIFTVALQARSSETHKYVEFAVVVYAHNNKDSCMKTIRSIATQTYPYWSMYLINDGSSDGTGSWCERCIHELDLGKKCKIIHNRTRKGLVSNIHSLTSEIDPKRVIVEISGTDWLANNRAFERLAEIYSNSNVWITHGGCAIYPLGWPIYQEVPFSDLGSGTRAQFSEQMVFPLRSYYAKLFQMIKKEDLLWHGQFFALSEPLTYMTPMIEMAGEDHVKNVREPLYVCNLFGPAIETKQNVLLLRDMRDRVLTLPAYQPLKSLFGK